MTTPLDPAAWARGVIRAARDDAGGTLPVYGSPEWGIADAPQRWAAAVVSAEIRRQDNTPEAIAEQLARELYYDRLKHLEDQDFAAQARAHRHLWLPTVPALRIDRRIAAGAALDFDDWVRGDAA